jgi:hypothetical protein
MKKAILFFVLLIGMIGFTFGQSATLSLGNDTYKEYNTNITVGSAATVWMQWNLNKENPVAIDFQVNLDSVSGGAHATTVKLYGSKFLPATWVKLGNTITWKATTADTTILMPLGDTTRYYNHLKLEVVNASGDVTTIDWTKLHLWKKTN